MGSAPSLASPLREVLGGRTSARLAKASLSTVSDLLRNYPRRYGERGRLTDLAELEVGESATVWVRIAAIDGRTLTRGKARHLTKIVVTDGNRRLECAVFNQPWLPKVLEVGTEAMVSGKVSEFRGTLQMSNPEIATVGGVLGDFDAAMQRIESFAGGIIPIYSATAGLPSSVLQQSVRQVLTVLDAIADPLPESLLAQRGLVGLDSALRNVHRPEGRGELDRALERLKYDEALALQLVLARRRFADRALPAAPCPRVPNGILDAFDAALPFELTAGQLRVGSEIAADLASIHPMNRLLQGEVGSGKTVVALRAMLQVIDSGRQAVLLAPTEVLATQHVRSVRAALGPLGSGGELQAAPGAISVTLLTGSAGAAARRSALVEIVSGRPGIVIGTHALLSDDVLFTNLGLVVIDEQHRFGVEQRDVLRSRESTASPPHVLVMTATPIPRTVAMTVYGDLDTSVLAGMPAGRAGVSTTVVPAAERPAWLDRVWQRVREEVAAGHQAYVVCPKIGDGDGADDPGDDDSPWQAVATGNNGARGEGDRGVGGVRRPPKAVLDTIEELRAGPLAEVRLGVLHGRMAPADKDASMREFAAGRIDVLVATTVIEVGVDVANASVMVVLDAERFGMSQLHQLRGRVGRGSIPGICLLVTDSPAGSVGRRRLDAVASTADGFQLAEEDLALRREGDVLGTNQAGRRSSLQLLSLRSDREVIEMARSDAVSLVGPDPLLVGYPLLAAMADALVDESSQDYLRKS